MEVCRKMQGDRIISALIGLVGAMSNNGKTERTDSVVREAFLRLTDGDSEEETVQKIHAEKFAIAPDCTNCLNPCGNTSDYDMAQFYVPHFFTPNFGSVSSGSMESISSGSVFFPPARYCVTTQSSLETNVCRLKSPVLSR